MPARTVFEELRFLQLVQPVAATLAYDTDAVQAVYRDYQELQLSRQGLTRIYALTLDFDHSSPCLVHLRWLS